MKLNKIFLLAGVAAMSLSMASCDDDDYSPGKEPGTLNTFFVNQENKVLDLEDMSFQFTISRKDGTGELTVPLKVIETAPCFTVPTSVTFAAGETSKDLTVQVDTTMEAFKNYPLRITIPEEFTNPYVNQPDSLSILSITVLKQDYAPYGLIAFYDGWNEEGVRKEIQYSTVQDLFFIPDAHGEGYGYYIDVKADSSIVVTDNVGNTNSSRMNTAYTHPTYGPVYAQWNSELKHGKDKDNGGYPIGLVDDEDENGNKIGIYFIPFTWRVAAGSFGTYSDYFYFLEVY
ncbi:MAG: hypothetical protein IJ244_04370 [Bacteroidaceae bacterium]|nr:hypothetical protein [Bacteroidaceae bacterium]